MSFNELDQSRNLFEYHSVFAASLAVYLNIRKEFEGNANKSARDSTSKFNEAMSIIRSNTLYAIMLKPTDMANEGIPTDDHNKLVAYIVNLEEESKKIQKDEGRTLDAMYCYMTRKQEIAGLTANSEKTMTSRMNMLISKVERESKNE